MEGFGEFLEPLDFGSDVVISDMEVAGEALVLFRKINTQLHRMGYHHPIACRDGGCNRCSLFMVSDFNSLNEHGLIRTKLMAAAYHSLLFNLLEEK